MNIAVITGASSGIGRDFSVKLVKEERFDEVWLIARRAERLEELKSQLGVPVRILSYDLTDPKSIEQYTKLLNEAKPNIAVLVNGSGFGKFALSTEIPSAVSMDMIDINVKALVAITDASLPFMSRGSRLINIGSLSAFQPVPYINVYAATKAFVLSYSRALNVELKPRGIKVIAVCPGWVKTEFFDHAVEDNGAVTYYNRIWESPDVVDKALRDLKKGKDVSVLGASVRFQVLLTKLLPHKMVMNVWMKQQKHDKREAV